MQKLRLVFFAVALLWGASSFAQGINSGSPKVPFGSQTKYDFGIMPTNLPTSGAYGRSSAAAAQYNYWVTNFVEKCSDNTYRVKFDDKSKTVSEGIAYGMLLSAYAGDKVHFDGFWAFFKKSMNKNGLMNWMTDGCAGNARDNAATDSDLDAAHALIIAAEQWPGGTYEADAKTLIGNIYQYEIDHQSFLTLSGDAWGSDACLNPSYQAPAYYRQYKSVDVANSSAWGSAVTSAESLLTKNAHATTGLVSNWCDKSGTANACGPNNPYLGYGSDACRTPWRMATDVLWHGKTTAATAYSISERMSKWLAGNETNLRGQMAQSAANPGAGSYSNGSYTTFALAPMAMDATYQESLNKCYSFTAGMSNDGAYFNETVRCLTLFVLTGNFWKPGSSGVERAPEVLSAVTNEDGTQITVTFTKDINTSSLGSASNFSVAINTVAANNAVTGITASGTNAVILTVQSGVCVAGKSIALAYSGTSIKSTDGAALVAFTGQYVKNLLKGNSTLIDNCDDGNATNLIGGVWFTFNDADNKGLSSVTPLSTKTDPLQMLGTGAEGSAKSAKFEFVLNKGGNTYDPFVGMGTTLAGANLTGTTGMSFWYKGAAFQVKVITPWPYAGSEDYGYFRVLVPAAANWTYFSKEWKDFTAPDWSARSKQTRSITTDLAVIKEFQWQVEGPAATLNAGDKYLQIDFVECNGLVPTKLTNFVVKETTDAIVTAAETAAGVDVVLYTDPVGTTQFSDTTLHLVYTPTGATYKEVVWTSANPAVASIKFNGEVTAYTSGKVKMTATAVVDNSIVATCEIKVIGKDILPESVTIATPTTTTLAIDETVQLSASILPVDAANKKIVWTSSSANAIVDATGLVTGRVAGTATIKAASEADPTVFKTIVITVTAAQKLVTSIIGIDATKTMTVGDVFTFVPTILPTDATDKTVLWVSSDPSTVSVSTDGKITALAVGSNVTITVKAQDGSNMAASCVVTVEAAIVKATSISLNKQSTSLAIGAKETLVATVLPSTTTNKVVSWTSDNANVASVNPTTGEVTAVAAGSAVITAKTTDGTNLTAVCGVEVLAAVKLIETITVNEGNISLVRNATKQLTTVITPSAPTNSALVWESLNPEFATVSATGLVTAVKAGVATIKVSSADAGTAQATITVTVTPILVSSISVNATKSIVLNDNATLAVVIDPINADNSVLLWSSSNANVTVDQTGKITGASVGSAIITVKTTDGSNLTKTIDVTVTDPNTNVAVTSVTLDNATLALKTGSSATLVAAVNPSNATNKDVTWTSSNANVASVNQLGKVTAVAKGSATITVTSASDATKTASCDVTVTDVAVSGISVSATSISVEAGKTAAINASAEPTNATVSALTYSILPAGIATYSNGTITGVAEGNATLTISATDGSGVTKQIPVTVTAATQSAILVSSIALDKSSLELEAGKTGSIAVLLVSPSNATNKAIVWTSSNTSVATVVNGTVTATGKGNAVIIASSADAGDAIGTCVVVVTAPVVPVVLVSSISLSESSLTLSNSASKQVTATVNPSTATNSAVEFISSNSAVAQVSATGVVTAVGSGQAVITARAKDGSGVFASIPVTVSTSNLATSISLSATNGVTTLSIGDNSVVTASVIPSAAAQAVKFVSSNNAVLYVSANGQVTATGAGTASITAIATDGSMVTKSLTFTVNPATVAVTSIAVTAEETALVVGDITFFSVSVLPATASNLDYRLETDVAGIISYDKTRGVITALAAGTVVLKATAIGDITKTSSVTIKVTAPVVVPINKDALTASIYTGTDLITIYGGTNNGTVLALVNTLKTTLADAKAVKTNTAATQAEVDAATKALLSAINKLNTAVIRTDDATDAITAARVYPVPATDMITVEGSKVISSVSVTGGNGVYKVLAVNVNATTVELSVAGLTQANYSLVVVYTDGTSKVLALSVQ